MGISRMSAMMIQGSDPENIKCLAGGPSKEGKYAGWIQLWKNGSYHTDIVSTQGIFDSKKEAVKHMKDLVKEIRKLDLTKC